MACFRNDLEVAQLLIQRGARVIYDGACPDVPCPLKYAAAWGSLELVQLLLDNSLFSASADDITPREHIDGETHLHPLTVPLETALSKNKLEAAQVLVNHGASVNEKPFLWQCARYGLHQRALFLLRNGADVNQTEYATGQTPLWIAAKSGNVELVKLLLKAEANVRIRDKGGDRPIEMARRNGHKGIVYLLLRTSPSVWSRLGCVR
jgi:ankyrin repeat protein